ncbi:MAG: hypothetical protein ACI85I_002893 [Arenicella sp.]|jgi:hypothetical protein
MLLHTDYTIVNADGNPEEIAEKHGKSVTDIAYLRSFKESGHVNPISKVCVIFHNEMSLEEKKDGLAYIAKNSFNAESWSIELVEDNG